jgi:hypothetical protein
MLFIYYFYFLSFIFGASLNPKVFSGFSNLSPSSDYDPLEESYLNKYLEVREEELLLVEKMEEKGPLTFEEQAEEDSSWLKELDEMGSLFPMREDEDPGEDERIVRELMGKVKWDSPKQPKLNPFWPKSLFVKPLRDINFQ